MRWIMNKILLYVVFQTIWPIFLFTRMWKIGLRESWDLIKSLYSTVSEAHNAPIRSLPHYQDKDLLKKIWEQPSAIPYISQNALEYQTREGYCGRATLRNVLKSYASFPSELVPPPNAGPTEPKKWTKMLHDMLQKEQSETETETEMDPLNRPKVKKNHNINIETKIIGGDETFATFIDTIRKAVRDPSCRLAINYLRPALTGFMTPRWIPIHLFLGLLGGHFSFIIGMLEKKDVGLTSTSVVGADGEDDNGYFPLVAVFDVNHQYGGAYLVPANRLYESVKARDLMTLQSRALVELRMDEGGGVQNKK